jgi:hypothetical protein
VPVYRRPAGSLVACATRPPRAKPASAAAARRMAAGAVRRRGCGYLVDHRVPARHRPAGHAERLEAQHRDPAWRNARSAVLTEYRTSRHYRLAFGHARRLEVDLIAVPARFVSRQDPATQGNPTGVTNCTYWPQYVFLVAKVGDRSLSDVAGDYIDRPSVAPLKRHDTVRGIAAEQFDAECYPGVRIFSVRCANRRCVSMIAVGDARCPMKLPPGPSSIDPAFNTSAEEVPT